MIETFLGLNHWQIDLMTILLLLQGAFAAVFPEEIILLTLGMFWARGQIHFLEALICVQLGLLPANAIAVFLGNRLGHRFARKKKGVLWAKQYLAKYGPGMLVATRFTPLIRGPVYLAVGLSDFGILRFIKWDALASCVQIPTLLLLGRSIGASAEGLKKTIETFGLVAVATFALLIGLTIFVETRSKQHPVPAWRST